MAEGEQPDPSGDYQYAVGEPPPAAVLQLWSEVGTGIDRNQTVVWKSAVDSLTNANKYLRSSKDARFFAEKYMSAIIGILVEQQPAKIGTHERNCVQESLAVSAMIVAQDLAIQLERSGQSLLLESLSLAFNRKKAFYKGAKGNWNVNHMQGCPEVRMRTVERFRASNGFSLLNRYIIQKTGTPLFPKLETVNHVLMAVSDSLVPPRVPPPEQGPSMLQLEEDALLMANAVMHFIASANEESLKKIPTDMLTDIQHALQRVFDRLIATRREETNAFYEFWRALSLKLIRSQSLPLKLYGWEQVSDLIDACATHRPPPKSFVVSNAGYTFANGRYEFAGSITPDGYARPGGEVSYVRKIPDDAPGGMGGKKLTIFRCTMRSQQKWWFLSEADEEQPGTDRDVDYYQHKSKEHEEAFPPPAGWLTCRNAGIDPPPNLEPHGVLVPAGEEYKTLDHQLARWAIGNQIVEQVLGDTTIHREVVARSTVLIKFLAGMCYRYPPTSEMTDGPDQAKYCLQSSHLLFAWKTCLRKADAAVSSQVYQLLVSILPLCPIELAVPLLNAVQTSLHDSKENRDHLFEVSEFCAALASGSPVDNKQGAVTALKEEVREEVLNLLWSVLTHPDASSLRSYESLKRYVTHELRVEPKGTELREKFLRSCIEALSEVAKANSSVDEVQALRMVKLTHFVMEACPREQADRMVSADSGALTHLLFDELTAYLRRRMSGTGSGLMPKTASLPTPQSDKKQHLAALNERTRVLRYVYGLVDPRVGPRDGIAMTADMVETLWLLCDDPDDREALMIFVASASHSGKVTPQYDTGAATVNVPITEQHLAAAFPEAVCQSIFLKLFCSSSFDYDQLGNGGYKSFQFLFNGLRHSPNASTTAKDAALDALWRICLTVSDDWVASLSMKDLLNVYVVLPGTVGKENGPRNSPERMVTEEKDDSFGERMFQCLATVKRELEAGSESSTRSLERCLRILNAAIGQSNLDGHSMTSTSLIRLSMLGDESSLDGVFRCLPHGMRGQAAYRRVGIIAKRPQAGNQNVHGGQAPRPPSTVKFPLDLHPLETLASVIMKVAFTCQAPLASVKPIQVNGRAHGVGARSSADSSQMSLNVVPRDSVVDELGIVEGCEIVFVIAERPIANNATLPAAKTTRGTYMNDLSAIFFNNEGKFSDRLFGLLLDILKTLPWKEQDDMTDLDDSATPDTHQLIWDFLLAMPTNSSIASRVKAAQGRNSDEPSVASEDDAMEVDPAAESWNQLLELQQFDRSVYVLLTIDASLRPAPEVLTILDQSKRAALQQKMEADAAAFRRSFIEAGGFGAVVKFFSASDGGESAKRGKTRRGNAVALRILKSCLFGDASRTPSDADDVSVAPDEVGSRLLSSLSDSKGLLRSLTSMVVDDPGISSSTITDVLRFLRLLFQSPEAAQSFVDLPGHIAERFLIIPLMHDDEQESARTSSSINATMHVRRSAHDLILQTPVLADRALPWLIKAIEKVDVSSDCTAEYFDVLEKLVAEDHATARSGAASDKEMQELGTMVCKKLLSCPRPTGETDLGDFSTGVLCGCLKLLRALIENGGVNSLRPGANLLVAETAVNRWSQSGSSRMASKSMFAVVSSTFGSSSDDDVLIDLMGAIFDGFLSPGGLSSVAICCDKESRRHGFQVVGAAARSCKGGDGYLALVDRINGLVSSAAPQLRHRWGQFGSGTDSGTRTRNSSKYSGLRNQGCTCYMNSLLQQLFMMPELRHSMCSAPLPSALRSSGTMSSDGHDLVGKKISLQWETGISFDAMVESFDASTGAHVIRYCPVQVATVGGANQQQVDPDDVERLPPQLPDEFILSEGRPGKETGVFEIVKEMTDADGAMDDGGEGEAERKIKETEDEAASRHLLEEVQRTFIHLDEGSRGRCFDPRALVEACACLKLEFDVWQQNDASEFSTKLLDRLEISLKKWAPSHFRYMDHTFGLKQTKQKICRECGLKTNREEKLLNIDCQIRGKTDIHEALAAMTEIEIMEGSNKVFCDSCKKNTDTILRTAISALPNMLILSLKRFDLDFNTFETVKLNSRCAFADTLNMKQYSLEGLEAMEKSHSGDPSPMDTDDESKVDAEVTTSTTSDLPDEDYEYRLAGVLVHAGVAQGGHYYSFIKDRNPGSEEKWYRFDDEDVTPFDPAGIESECFGGKMKKETKWPNGQVHTVEQEQFANALMLFYEKVKPTDPPADDEADEAKVAPTSTGYDVFKADVSRSNASHRWQSFLFDSELQTFLKGMLGMCRLGSENQVLSADANAGGWRQSVLQMVLSFVFDVLLYSSDRSFLNEWTRMLEEALLFDRSSGRSFVHGLAKRTRAVSSNWLRTFLVECPDQGTRTAAVRVFSAAIKSCTGYPDEITALMKWSQAWIEQSKSFAIGTVCLPCNLQGPFAVLEDIDKLGDTASAIGVILSFVSALLDALPRCWRFSSEPCAFVRQLATMPIESHPDLLRRAMVVGLIPPRLVALVARDRLQPVHFRATFAGASVAPEVASTQTRPESNAGHVMPLGGSHVIHGGDMNQQRGPGAQDYLVMLETLACIGGLPGVQHATLVHDSGEINRGRRRYVLSEAATQALTIVFQDCCSTAPGMGQREIEQYLSRCGVDTTQVTAQKILDMLAKYPTASMNGQPGASYLSLEGFLAYYRDHIQNNDLRLRLDLHIFGFRPDLSRRSPAARYNRIGERVTIREPAESVATDVGEMFGDGQAFFGPLADACMSHTFHLYSTAFNVSEPLAMYLVAGAAYKKDCNPLIDRILLSIYQTPNDWGGNEIVNSATMALLVIATLPGPDRDARISRIMESGAKVPRNVDHGAGLLHVLQFLQECRATQHYSSEFHWTFGRYIDIIKNLRKTYAIHSWMNENRPSWAFIERDVFDNRPMVQQQQHPSHQMRGDYGARDGVAIPIDHHTHSDSDIAGMNDSEDDEDSQFELGDKGEQTVNEGPYQIVVQGAGKLQVNGVYHQDGYFQDACRFVMEGEADGKPTRYYIFQCNVSNNTKHWYISIVPNGSNPGTSSDIDFYTAPVNDSCRNIPPMTGWAKANVGEEPAPSLAHRHKTEEDVTGPEIWNGIEDEENQDGHGPYLRRM